MDYEWKSLNLALFDGVLAVNLFFGALRYFGKSKIQNQKSKIIPRGLRCFGKKRSPQVIRSGDLTVVSSHYPAQEGTIRSLLLIPPPAPLSFFSSESLIHHSK